MGRIENIMIFKVAFNEEAEPIYLHIYVVMPKACEWCYSLQVTNYDD